MRIGVIFFPETMQAWWMDSIRGLDKWSTCFKKFTPDLYPVEKNDFFNEAGKYGGEIFSLTNTERIHCQQTYT